MFFVNFYVFGISLFVVGIIGFDIFLVVNGYELVGIVFLVLCDKVEVDWSGWVVGIIFYESGWGVVIRMIGFLSSF